MNKDKQIEGEIFRAVQDVGVTVERDELIKALKYDREQYEKGYRDGSLGYEFNKWVSVEDMLPDENGTYLVVGKSNSVHTAHFYKEHTINGKTFSAHFSNRYVRYWQPLPQPPAESEAEE